MHYQQAIDLSPRQIAIRITIVRNEKRVFARGINNHCEMFFRGRVSKIDRLMCEGFLDWYPIEFIIQD